MTAISGHYRQLSALELPVIAYELANAWKNAEIPQRQWELCCKSEIENLKKGKSLPTFDALLNVLRKTKIDPRPRLLDVGASSAVYSEILRILKFDCHYEAVDYSPAFARLAEVLFPSVPFTVANAAALPFESDSFDIVVSGSVIIHTLNHIDIIAEAARVSSRYVVLHRTPIVQNRPTEYFEKEAYGIRTLEVHYDQASLLAQCRMLRLELQATELIFFDAVQDYGHCTFLLEKV